MQLVPAIFREATNGVGLFDSTDETNKVMLWACYSQQVILLSMQFDIRWGFLM